jgi:hypothetical protein
VLAYPSVLRVDDDDPVLDGAHVDTRREDYPYAGRPTTSA